MRYNTNKHLCPPLRKIFVSALRQPQLSYGSFVRYQNLRQNHKIEICTILKQNKYTNFCFQLDKMAQISHKEYKAVTWLLVNKHI